MRILLFVLSLFIFTGCAKLTYDPQKDYGFDSGKIKELPPLESGKARIMVFRPSAFQGAMIRYNMSVDLDPKFIDDSDNIDKSTPKIFLGLARSSSAFYRDITPSNKKVVIHAATEAQYNLPLLLQANKAYCLQASVGAGFFVGRPYFVPVEYEKCVEKFLDYYDEDDKEQWLKDEANFIKKQEARESEK